MLKKAILALSILTCAFAFGQSAPRGDGTGGMDWPRDKRYPASNRNVKPIMVSTDTAPIGETPVWNQKPNEGIEDELIGERYYPKEGDLKPNVIMGTPNIFDDSFNQVTYYEGITPTGWRPPDPDLAVGQNHQIQVVNVSFSIRDKANNVLYANSFANFVPSAYSGYFLFDPKVIYDPWWDRYTMMIHAQKSSSPTDSALILFCSDDGNPIGSWYTWIIGMQFNFGGGNTWADYYDLGYGVDTLLMGGNNFRFSGGYDRSVLVIARKSSLYTGSAFWNYRFPPNASHRAVDQLNGGVAGADGGMFVSAQGGGGNFLTLYKVTDPFGACTVTPTNIAVPAYGAAPTALQPGGAGWFGFDARLIEAKYTSSPSARLYTGHQINVGGTMGLGMYDLNPNTNSLNWSAQFWYGAQWSIAMPDPVIDYKGNVMWVNTVAGHAAGSWAPTVGTIYFINNVYNANFYPAIGSNNTPDGRWGDYAGGNLDWGDYYNQGGTTADVKFWLYGEQSGGAAVADWRTRVIVNTAENIAPGLVTANNPNPVFYNVVGAGSGYTSTIVVSNSGAVGVGWEAISYPAWVTPTTATSGTLYAGGSTNLTFQSNANANSLPYGRHTATVTLRNTYNGATIARNIMTLSLGYWICPDPTIFMYSGTPFVGDGSDLCVSDNNYFSLFCDDFTYVSDFFVRYSGVIDGSEYAYNFVEASAERGGLALQRFMWNSDGSGWILVGGSVCPTSDATYLWGSGQGNANPFVHPSGWAWSRIRTEPINDEDPSQDGWLTNVDTNLVWTYP